MRRRRAFTRGGSYPRAKYLWETVITVPETLPANTNGLTSLMPTDSGLITATEVTNRDLVVVRMLGNVFIEPTTTFAQRINWAQGVLPITQQAFDAAAIPLPQLHEPGWLYQQSGAHEAPDITVSGNRFAVVPLDVKGRRKVPKSGMLLFHILRNIGSVSLDFQLHLRVLYRLP